LVTMLEAVVSLCVLLAFICTSKVGTLAMGTEKKVFFA